jgi:myo-inositol catabolism protein IolC
MSEKRILNGVQVRFLEPDLDRLEAYRRAQRKIPTMAATVRGLVLLGLKAAAADTKRSSIEDTTA